MLSCWQFTNAVNESVETKMVHFNVFELTAVSELWHDLSSDDCRD